MSWNGIGVGWPNATSIGLCLGPGESYSVYDCILESTYVTGLYEPGTFNEGDRVYTQQGNYGYIQNLEIPRTGGIDTEAFPIGFVDNRCNDCTVNLNAIINNDGENAEEWFIYLDGTESLDEVNFQSNVNTLFVTVSYYAQLEAPESGPITESGFVTFEITSYNIPAGGEAVLLGSINAFTTPDGEDYYIVNSETTITNISIEQTALGPYDTGWDVPNKYVTEYGNVWTMYY